MADVATPAEAISYMAEVVGRADTRYGGVYTHAIPAPTQQDFRQINKTNGVISDQVVLKTGPGTEVPFVNGLVWLLRVPDGRVAWAGYSDAGGSYHATGLESGIDYVPVAVDKLRNQKATAAGPVTAMPAP